jgi:hypothetical protein
LICARNLRQLGRERNPFLCLSPQFLAWSGWATRIVGARLLSLRVRLRSDQRYRARPAIFQPRGRAI